MTEMGLPLVSEPNDGTCVGAMINPSSMSAQNQSRSDSRTAYLDPVIDRPNLHIATEQMVTRVLLEEVDNPIPGVGGPTFDRLQKAVGVEVCVRKSFPQQDIYLYSSTAVCAFEIQPQSQRELLQRSYTCRRRHFLPHNFAIIRHRP